MSQKFGYMGKILWVNLSTKELTEETPTEEIYRNYLGGYGLGLYYIYNRIKPNCDPFGPDNIIGFCPGLLTGSPAPFTGRYMVCGKSPLTGRGEFDDGFVGTGGWGDSNSGGYFSPAIKRAGYDAIFFTGISPNPVYLLIDEDKKELVDASSIWGKNGPEVEKIIEEKHGKCNIAMIGIGGENKVRFAGVVNDGGRIAARSGLGAVMGSKKLKAVVLKGSKKVVPNNPEQAKELSKAYTNRIQKKLKKPYMKVLLKSVPSFTPLIRLIKLPLYVASNFKAMSITMFSQFLHYYGTPWFTDVVLGIGDSPVKNFAGSIKDYGAKDVKPITTKFVDKYKVKPYGCYSCPIRCGAICKVPDLKVEETHRPEYETISAFGSLILNNDLSKIYEINEYLNASGVDTISCGVVVAYVLECVEKGILKKEDFKCKEFPEGFLPQFRDPTYLLPLVKLIVTREGIGNILGNGVKDAGQAIKGSEAHAVHFNGGEPPMHDSRLMRALGITYTSDPTPGRHTAGGALFIRLGAVNAFIKGLNIKIKNKPEKMGVMHAKAAKFQQAIFAMGFCEFSMWCGYYGLLEMIKAVVGWNITLDEIIEIGGRIQTLRQMFNAREGAIRHEATARAIGDPPLKEGPLKGRMNNYEPVISVYYKTMGFKEDGVPTEEALKKCGLDFAIKDLPKARGRPKPMINQSEKNKK